MKIREHLDKIAWSVLDKGLYVLYGFVFMLVQSSMDLPEYGLYGLLIGIQQWIFTLSDTSALQGIIQFGVIEDNRKKVNFISMMLHIGVAMGVSLIFAALSPFLAVVLNEPKIADAAIALPILNLTFIPRTYCIKLFYRDSQMSKLFISDLLYLGLISVFAFYTLLTKGWHLTYYNLVVFNIVGAAISSIVTIAMAWKQLEFGRTGDIKLKDMLKFSIPLTITSAIHNIPRQLDVYIVQFFFSTSATGIYAAAKNLYRFFDSASDAAFGLIYPAAVRKVHSGDKKALNLLFSKAISFTFVGIAVAIIILEAGGSSFLVNTFMSKKYAASIGQFNIMMLAALGLPLILLSVPLVARNQNFKQLRFVATSAVISTITFVVLGTLKAQSLIPLGLIAYTWSYSVMSLVYAYNDYGFKFINLFSSIKDGYNFGLELIGKKKR